MSDLSNRRPLRSRQTGWARAAASALVARGISPNAISAGAVGFAATGFLAFALAGSSGEVLRGLALILAALTCQARLICNLLDGMVAVEGGRGTKDGPFWNEAPDRLADVLFFAGAGLAVAQPALGLLAAISALCTAYLRELGRAEGLPADFGGPMAKQHRMAALTLGSLLAVVWPAALVWTLWIVVIGTTLTAALRARRLIAGLEAR